MSLPLVIAAECPSEEDVACFLEGRATPTLGPRLRLHLDACEPCRQLLAGALSPDGPSVVRASSAVGPRTFSLGELVQQRYRIVRFIARGGMGEVYEARDLQLDETVALKTIVCTNLDDERLLSRIRAEVLLARRITHTNVCRILEFGLFERKYRDWHETIPYFTMEFLRGETLKQYAARRGPLALEQVLPIARQILDGIEAVHAAGIVHRDLKPENVCIVQDGGLAMRAVVMDFGLARSTLGVDSRLSTSLSAVGTPAYMAPEQMLGGPPSPAWDIYATGVMLFELAAGVPPFAGGNSVAAALARVRTAAPSLSSVCKGVHPRYEAIVARCLHRNPKRRFTCAKQLRQALQDIALVHGGAQRTPRRTHLSYSGFVAGIAVLGMSWLPPNWHSEPPRQAARLSRLQPTISQLDYLEQVTNQVLAGVGLFSNRNSKGDPPSPSARNSGTGSTAMDSPQRYIGARRVQGHHGSSDGNSASSNLASTSAANNDRNVSPIDALSIPSFAASVSQTTETPTP